jgi:hypothetical protein
MDEDQEIGTRKKENAREFSSTLENPGREATPLLKTA